MLGCRRNWGAANGGSGVSDRVRIAIIGSGPAGLSAAARAAQLGLSHVLLEKSGHLSDTIYRYQKGKHVMATPSQLVLRADLPFEAGKRETILGAWDQRAAAQKLTVRLHSDVKAITGERGDFTIALADGTSILAETVVLAIGTQGNPNLMRCAGADLPHVEYQLDDPAAIIDEHIVVVGSGDAGIENALGLAAVAAQGNVVTILNRSGDFARAKGANVKLLTEAAEQGRVAIRLNTTPSEVRAWRAGDRDARRRRDAALRPDHRAHGIGRAARVRRKLRDRVQQRRPRGVSETVLDLRDDQARHLRDRRAGRLSADQALHEPGP